MLNKQAAIPKVIIYIVLALMTLAVFRQVHQFDFINIDDNIYVTENIHIQSGLSPEGIRWAFTTTYADFWHPMTWLSLMTDYQLHGLNAGGYHVTNLILHILSTLLLFGLFHRMTREIWKSAFVAAVFALHPLHVESVAWITERKDVLSAFFGMLTLYLYVHYLERQTVQRYLLVLLSFALALMSKPMVVTLPVIMMLLDYWPLKRFQSLNGSVLSWQIKEKISFFVLSAAFSIMTMYAQYKPSAKIIPLGDRIANALVSFITYPGKIFWPLDLSFFYSLSENIQTQQILGSSALIIMISMIVIRMAGRMPYLLVGWLWYSVMILPVLGITYTGVHWTHDLYTYLPSIGIVIGVTWGVSALMNKNRLCTLLLSASIIVLIMISLLSWKQCGYWKNSIELLNHSLYIAKNNYLAYDQRGIAYGQTGQYQKAINDFNTAIDLKSDYYKGYNNRGFAYMIMGQYPMAIKDYDEAIRLNPSYAKAYHNRAMAHLNHGNNLEGCKDAQKACELGSCVALQEASHKALCR